MPLNYTKWLKASLGSPPLGLLDGRCLTTMVQRVVKSLGPNLLGSSLDYNEVLGCVSGKWGAVNNNNKNLLRHTR